MITPGVKPNLIAVHLVRYSKQPEYLLLRRSSPYLYGTWQMVTGKIENNESAYESAIREVKEETGLIIDEFYSGDFIESFYEARKDSIHFVAHFVGFVSPEMEVVLSPKEHDKYEWVPMEKVADRLCFSSQKTAFHHIVENFIQKKPFPFLKIN